MAAQTEPTLAQRVRFAVFQHFIDTGEPPLVEGLMTDFGLSRAETGAVLRDLAETRGVAVVKGTSRILMAWPFSAIATPFRVTARGRNYYANCSWDAIAFHAMLGNEPVHVDSFCHFCAAPIALEFADGRATKVEPAATIVYLALRPTQWWEDIILTCSNTMVFFCSAEHRDASGLVDAGNPGASLTPQQAHDLGVPIYADRMKIDYVRPGRDALNAHFAAVGLTGPYWQI
ncbi:MAG: organomercurial lyase [Chloroflexota bacterium]|nr:organomercurial lyase [Chloroflexota bacterium]